MKSKILTAFTAVVLFLMPFENFGQAPNLGTTSTFTLFTATGAINNVGLTTVTGDIGTHVGAFNGFPPGVIVGGTSYVANATSAQAAIDVDAAYNYLSSIAGASVIGVGLGNGQILTPGIIKQEL